MNIGFPYSGQGNYNGYYPSRAGNLLYPPGRNVVGPMRSGAVDPQIGSNMGPFRKSAPLPSTSANK
jgi:hypothetical protein